MNVSGTRTIPNLRKDDTPRAGVLHIDLSEATPVAAYVVPAAPTPPASDAAVRELLNEAAAEANARECDSAMKKADEAAATAPAYAGDAYWIKGICAESAAPSEGSGLKERDWLLAIAEYRKPGAKTFREGHAQLQAARLEVLLKLTKESRP